MNNKVVSSIHGLRLTPIDRLIRFARVDSQVYLSVFGDTDSAGAVPGSIRISSTLEEGTIKEKISYYRSDVCPQAVNFLQRYKGTRFIATYIDESGSKRVAGSPDWPLSLDYTTGEGVITVTISGESTVSDAFLTD